LGYASDCVKAPDLAHIGLSEFCPSDALATGKFFWMGVGTGSFAARLSPLSCAIGIVLRVGSKPEMNRVNTGWPVSTWAIVTNAQAVRDFPKAEHPTDAGSLLRNPLYAKTPISPSLVTGPEPAFLRSSFIDKPPKAVLDFGRNLCQKAISQFRTHSTGLVRVQRSLKRSLCSLFYQFGP
jgi:hypothetical protein